MARSWPAIGILIITACTGGGDSTPSTSGPSPPPSTSSTSTSTAVPAVATSTAATEPEEASLPVLDDLEAPAWEPATRSEELAMQIDAAGAPIAQQAVDAFGLLVGEMPGVTATDLPPGEGLGDTYTRRLVEAVRDELTPTQLAVVEDYLEAGTVVGTVAPDGSITVADDAAAAGTTSNTTVDPAPATGPPDTGGPAGVRRPSRAPGEPIDLDYLELLGAVQKDWAQHLPDHPTHEIELVITPKSVDGMDAWVDPDDSGKCRIRVHAGFFQSNPSDDKIRFFFAHELFHCMQFAWANGPTPLWLDEGSADWAAADLYRGRTLDYDELDVRWFTQANAPLAVRSYTAWPFFENTRLSGHDAYDVVQGMFEEPHPTVSAALAEAQLDGELFRKDWSSRTLRSDAFDATWQLPWPAPDAAFGPHDNVFGLGARGLGTYNVVGAGSYTQQQLTVEMTSQVGLATVTPTGGPLTTHTAVGTQTVGDGATRTFCFAPDGCACPAGGTSGAVPMDGPDMIFSFAAAAEGTVAAVRAEEWDPEQQCHDDPESEQGESNGDPHLLSFDGLPFDVVTLGEFVVARDPAGDLEVQTRHEPIGFGAGTTAVAIGAGAHRVTFTLPDFESVGPPVVRVDGDVATGGELTAGEIRVTITGSDAVAAWPDGSTVSLHWFRGWFVQVTVPGQRAARMEGLLGSADGDIGNDLRLPDGTVVDTVDAARPESEYALAWAVDEATTLFDYEPGQSVSTFRIPHPDPEPLAIDPVAVDDCADALGEAAAAHEISSCAYDVSVTGDAGFVEEYATIVEERVAGEDTITQLPTTTPPTTGGPAAESEEGVPTLILSGETPSGTIDVVEGSVLLARTASCDRPGGPDRAGYVDIVVHPAGDFERRAIAALCDPSGLGDIGAGADDEWIDGEAYVWLPGSGTYEVFIEQTLGDREAIAGIEIFTDPTPTVLRAADMAAGDRRTLAGVADTVVYLPRPADRFEADGFQQACAVEVYWGADEEFPRPEPFDLDFCAHSTEIDFPPTDMVIPVVVFNRTGDEIALDLTPAD